MMSFKRQIEELSCLLGWNCSKVTGKLSNVHQSFGAPNKNVSIHGFECLAVREGRYFRGIKRCGFVRGSLSLEDGLGLQNLKPGPVFLSSFSLCIPMKNPQFLPQDHAWLRAAVLLTMLRMNCIFEL